MTRSIRNTNKWIKPGTVWAGPEGGYGGKTPQENARNINAVTTDMLNAPNGIATRGSDLYLRPENLPGYDGSGYGPPMLKILKLGNTSEATEIQISNYTSFVKYNINLLDIDGTKQIFSFKSSLIGDDTNLAYLDTIVISPPSIPKSYRLTVGCSGWNTSLTINIPL